MVKEKWTNNDLQNSAEKAEDLATLTSVLSDDVLRVGKQFLLHSWHQPFCLC
jgi:hypothetical protein